MSRTHKLRGKRVDNGQWIYGSLIIDEISDKYYIVISIEESEKVGEEGCLRVISCEIDKETVGQYIGIVDKNSKEIYLGDIVIVTTYSYEEPLIVTTCVVEYDDEYCLYNFTEIGAKGVYSYSMIEIRNSFKYELEVIGNKYENPELEGEE